MLSQLFIIIKNKKRSLYLLITQLCLAFITTNQATAAENATPEWEVKTLLGTVNSQTPIASYVELLLLFIYSLIGGITILRITMGGYKYIQASGNPVMAKEAKETIQHAITGLILVLAAFLITDLFLGEQGLITQTKGGPES